MNVGDTITFYNDDFNHREIKVIIKRISTYNTFEEYLRKETLKKCLLGFRQMMVYQYILNILLRNKKVNLKLKVLNLNKLFKN